ncbi:MAG: hypothetical protein ACOX5R_13440 [bacterium]|jgi:hypothetical protein
MTGTPQKRVEAIFARRQMFLLSEAEWQNSSEAMMYIDGAEILMEECGGQG